MKKVYYGYLHYDGKLMYVYASDKGLVFVSSLDKPEEVYDFVPNIIVERNQIRVKPYLKALEYYLYRGETRFNMNLDLDNATEFQKTVWNALNEIPYGQTVSYKYIARRINKANGIRAVSNAIAKNPYLIIIPCHRVIGENGDLKGYRAGLELKQQLINLEHTISAYNYRI